MTVKKNEAVPIVPADVLADAAISEYPDMVATLAQRRRELRLTQEQVDDLAGMSDRYTGKLEAGMRRAGRMTFGLLLQSLQCRLIIVTADGKVLERVPAKPGEGMSLSPVAGPGARAGLWGAPESR